jgi:anthranilate 1,2-dioxygenase small subunit
MTAMFAEFNAPVAKPAEHRDLRLEIEEFHYEYCNALDTGRLLDWPEFFTPDALYRITARENADAGLPVGLVYCDGRGMLRDRAKAVVETQMYAPRYLLHAVNNVRVVGVVGQEIKAQANYFLHQTLVEGPTTLHQAGRYFDTFIRVDGRLLLKERQCVYDTELIANDIVYPV